MTGDRWFNLVLGAQSLLLAQDWGLLDRLASAPVRQQEVEGGGPRVVDACLRSLAEIDVVTLDGEQILPGQQLNASRELVGYFRWLLRGNGQLLWHAPADGTADQLRDYDQIARAGVEYGTLHVDQAISEFVGHPRAGIVDIGCGSGARLIEQLRANPYLVGLGIDRQPGAVHSARARILEAGLASRIRVIQADASRVHEPFEETYDCLLSIFMAHDLWSDGVLTEALDRWLDVWPTADRLILVDTVSVSYEVGKAPAFGLAFELVHALLDERVPSRDELRDAIRRSRWSIEHEVDIPLPGSLLFSLSR